MVSKEEGAPPREEEEDRDGLDARVRRDIERLCDALREIVSDAPCSVRELERRLGLGDRYIPRVLKHHGRLRAGTIYRILRGAGEEPAHFFLRLHAGPPSFEAFLRDHSAPAIRRWPGRHALWRVAQEVLERPSETAGEPAFEGDALRREVHKASGQPSHLRRKRFRYNKTLQHPSFAWALCEHLDELRYDAPAEGVSAAWDVVEALVPSLRGEAEERAAVFVAMLGVCASALRQQRKLDRAAFMLFHALRVAEAFDLQHWVGRTLQRAAFLAIYLEEGVWAKHLLYEAQSIFEELGDRVSLAKALVHKSYLSLYVNRYRSAIHNAKEALSIFREEGFDDNRYLPAAHQYLSHGFLQLDISTVEYAMKSLETAIERAADGPQVSLGILLGDRAGLLSRLGKHEQAAHAYLESANTFQLCEAWTLQARALILLAREVLSIDQELGSSLFEVHRLTALLMRLDPEELAARAALMVIKTFQSGTPNREAVQEAVELCRADRGSADRTHGRHPND